MYVMKMKIEEAIKIHSKCDAEECDCEKCPIGKEISWDVTDGGVSIKASVCSMILFLGDMLEQKE